MEQVKLRGAIEDVVAETRHNNAAREIDSHPLYIQLQEQFARALEKLRLSERREVETKEEVTKLAEAMRILLSSSIRGIQKDVHACAVSKGWWDVADLSPERISANLALIHSEVSEALEDVRAGDMRTSILHDGKPVGFPTEIADVVIRCMDLAEKLGIDLQKEIQQKHEYNLTRPYKHGNKKL